MLVLTRRNGQEIVIGDDIVIRLLDTPRRGEAVIGIEAPKEVKVNRRERYEREKGQADCG